LDEADLPSPRSLVRRGPVARVMKVGGTFEINTIRQMESVLTAIISSSHPEDTSHGR